MAMEVAFLAPNVGHAAMAASHVGTGAPGPELSSGFGMKLAAGVCSAAAVGLASNRKRAKTAARYT
eukprot:CAMPEP_0114661470 /NCGR_PEP_ID=MMETSP0191-20121206/22553_1 /TAXON_ID=126664 /ORGANISM="Sorites sp." /LENGTH=65 /DNA_ID=CAMNT_0001894071 /DNA_START=77 /DNA_END=270 /DNA_ORIENTATION=+